MLRGFTDQQRLKFLSFVTASTALPARHASGDSDDEGGAAAAARGMVSIAFVNRTGFPLAHTCFNRLDLPDYGNEALLREKLTWCLDNLEMAGFGEA